MVNRRTAERLIMHPIGSRWFEVRARVYSTGEVVTSFVTQRPTTFRHIYRESPPQTRFVVVRSLRRAAIRVIDMDAVDLVMLVPNATPSEKLPFAPHRFASEDKAIAYAVINL